jgi:hypothetical protein
MATSLKAEASRFSFFSGFSVAKVLAFPAACRNSHRRSRFRPVTATHTPFPAMLTGTRGRYCRDMDLGLWWGWDRLRPDSWPPPIVSPSLAENGDDWVCPGSPRQADAVQADPARKAEQHAHVVTGSENSSQKQSAIPSRQETM